MSELNFTKEILDGTTYYSASDARGNETTIFESQGEMFVVTSSPRRHGGSAPKCVSDIKKKSKTLAALLDIAQQDKEEESQGNTIANPRYKAFNKEHGEQPNWVYMDFISKMKTLYGLDPVNGHVQNHDEFTDFIKLNAHRYKV